MIKYNILNDGTSYVPWYVALRGIQHHLYSTHDATKLINLNLITKNKQIQIEGRRAQQLA